MADKEIVPYVAPKSRQGDPLSPMEQYFAEALQEEAFLVTATSPATPRSTPEGRTRGALGVGRPITLVGRLPHEPIRLQAPLVVLHRLVEHF